MLLLTALLIPTSAFALNIGVGSYINSLEAGKQQGPADLLGETNSNWTRLEVPYDPATDFVQLDSALSKTKGKGIKVLALFGHKSGITADQFENFVDTVVNRHKDNVDAYEIFNEVDNTMSAGDYKPFLEKAHGKIKAIDGSATVVASGLTGRKEAISFWNGLYDAGGGSFFDALGIHPYRTSSPETKEFNIGNWTDTLNQVVGVISSHGGGKKVWLTEFGWKTADQDESTQGNYLARASLLSATVPSVANIISYKLFDIASGESFGIAKNDLTKKASFGTVATVIEKIKGLSFKERVEVANTKSIDNFDAGVKGWKDDGSSGGSVALEPTGGRSGGGMKYKYNFSSGSGYTVARKQVALEGNPSGLTVWIDGSSGSSVWKLRIVDKNNETFQFDLGQASAGFKEYRFDFDKDKAKTSWGGDGKIDYPAKFDSIVLDNQDGSSSGEVVIDDLAAVYGEGDMYALRFGDSLLAYWKASGSAQATVCGKSLTFETSPKYTTVSSCEKPVEPPPKATKGATPTVKPTASPSPSPSPSPTPSPTATPTATATPEQTAPPAAPGRQKIPVRYYVGGGLLGLGLAALIAWRLGILTRLRRP